MDIHTENKIFSLVIVIREEEMLTKGQCFFFYGHLSEKLHETQG